MAGQTTRGSLTVRCVSLQNAMEAAHVSPLPLNCPERRRRMEYISAIADGIHLYRCAVHGEWQLGPGDIHRPPLEGLTTP